MIEKKKNHYLNYWKGLACFGVVFFHTRFPVYTIDGIIQAIFRFAIPLFFMVSGYFCYYGDYKKVEQKLPAKIKRTFIINLIGCVYYFIMQLAIAMLGNSHGNISDVSERFHMMFNKTTMLEWFIFNQDPFVNIMWFTSALLYCYLIFWVVNHFNLYKWSYGIMPVLFLAHFFIGNIPVLIGQEFPKIYYRNFLLFGLPFFLLGNWLHKEQEMIMERLKVDSCRILLGVGVSLSVLEWFWLGRHEMFVGSILIVVSVFVLSLHQPEKKKNSFITKIGTEYSLFIYIVHYSLMIIMERYAGKFIGEGKTTKYYIFYFVRPFLIFGICIIGAYIFYKVMNQLRKWRRK